MAASRYIAIEGPIGVGKTSLARRLADQLDGELVLEEAGANPFLERFYQDPRGGALPAQLFFMFQRVRQLEQLAQADMFSDTRVSDFLMAKDRLFAQTTLDRNELALYEQIYATLEFNPPVPDLVVYLQAPVDALLFRIARRGINYEVDIKRRYLERITDAYSQYFHQYNDSPLLIVNAATIDPVNNDQHFHMLMDEIDTARSGRQFFNPLVSAFA
ncbi:MAG: deoxynucleoside kinase [Chromatiales bacterium]|jgi:deoxyadenosine/deoxycytidine kinase|nr:deoxynucleoside kinase [Chromatiales bacterium]MDP7270812.1 deoxynucleoside kinase [Gammaproteobacteria bacterium]HJP04861.1 deoxynucleoside kinase [Gammaproteobacteria bacterium]